MWCFLLPVTIFSTQRTSRWRILRTSPLMRPMPCRWWMVSILPWTAIWQIQRKIPSLFSILHPTTASAVALRVILVLRVSIASWTPMLTGWNLFGSSVMQVSTALTTPLRPSIMLLSGVHLKRRTNCFAKSISSVLGITSTWLRCSMVCLWCSLPIRRTCHVLLPMKCMLK